MTITGIIKSSGTKAAITALSIQEGASCWLIRNKETTAACISIPRLTWPLSLHFVFLRSSKHSRQESFINLFDIKKLVFIKGGLKAVGRGREMVWKDRSTNLRFIPGWRLKCDYDLKVFVLLGVSEDFS